MLRFKLPPRQPSVSSAELTAAQKEAQRLRKELAALKAQQEQQQQSISADNQIPLISIIGANTVGKQGVIKGYVTDNTGVAEVTIDGSAVLLTSTGTFKTGPSSRMALACKFRQLTLWMLLNSFPRALVTLGNLHQFD